MDLNSLNSFFFLSKSNRRILNIVDEQSKILMSCPYKWHSKRSFLISLHLSILKKDFHVLNKISICQRNEYKSWMCSVGTFSVERFVIYTLIPLNRLLQVYFIFSKVFNKHMTFPNRISLSFLFISKFYKQTLYFTPLNIEFLYLFYIFLNYKNI